MLFRLISLAIYCIPFSSTEKISAPDGAIYIDNEWVALKIPNDKKNKPLPPISESWKAPTTEMFISIVHYRDDRCGKTLFNIFKKAKYPKRINIGMDFYN